MMGTKTTSRVLVVDDEPQVVWMLQFSLEAEGYQTLSAPTDGPRWTRSASTTRTSSCSTS